MDRRNKHLSGEERGVIFAEHERGTSQQGIGRLLGRPACTIGRELAHGRQDDGGYCPQAARRVYDERRAGCRRKRKLVEGDDLYRLVPGKLVHLRWSLEQIANRLRRMKPDDPTSHVSHETIYAAIYAQPRGGLKNAMIEALRQSRQRIDPQRGPVVDDIKRQVWSNSQPIRQIFKRAFAGAGLPYFTPHRVRNTVVEYAYLTCRTPEEFKAFSQNLGHESVVTTLSSYDQIPLARQRELIRNAGKSRDLDAKLERLLEVLDRSED